MARLFAALRPGGALVLSEKIRDPDPEVDALLGTLHHDFKAAQGYSPAEIEGKRQALETVLIRETVADHQARLRQAGFIGVTVLLQQLNFVTFLAVKPHAALAQKTSPGASRPSRLPLGPKPYACAGRGPGSRAPR